MRGKKLLEPIGVGIPLLGRGLWLHDGELELLIDDKNLWACSGMIVPVLDHLPSLVGSVVSCSAKKG